MALKLVVTTNVDGDVFEILLKNARYGVGRRHDNDLRIKETYISGYHAELVRGEKDEYHLSDLGSSNGTFLNGRRISGKEEIKAGDFIKFGILKVAVQESTDEMPKIVALKDRPGLVKREGSQTAAISLERKTGSVATAGPGTASGETRATPTESPDSGALAKATAELAEAKAELERERKALGDLRESLDQKSAGNAALEIELAEARKLMSERESELRNLVSKSRDHDSIAERLQTLERELAESREKEERLASGLADQREEEGKSLAEAARERDRLEESIRRKEKDLATSQAALAALSVERDSLKSDLDSFRSEIESERKSMGASAKEKERERTKVEKALVALEGKNAKQAEDLSVLKASLHDREKELRAATNELAALAKAVEEKDALRVALDEAREALAAAAAKEAEWTAIEVERKSRLEALESGQREAESKTAEISAILAERTAALALLEEERGMVATDFERFRQRSGEEMSVAKKSFETELEAMRDRLDELAREAGEAAARLEEAGRKNASLAEDGISLRAELVQRSEREERAAGELSGLLAELGALRTEFTSTTTERDELRGQVALQAGDLQAAKAEANGLRIELRKTRESSDTSLRELETSLRSRIAELETAFSSEKIRANDTVSEKVRLEEALAALRIDLEGACEESAQLKLRQEEASRTQGRLQAELNRESTERLQAVEALAASRTRADGFVADLESLKLALESREREFAEREQQHSRSESETVQKLKRELSESLSARDAAEERSAKAAKEKQTLAGAFERLKDQLDQTEAALRAAKGNEEELSHGKGLLARRLEKAEASNSELAARIKEDATAALANRQLIEKLELQIRENESEAVQREREQVCALQADLSRASRRAAEDERRRRELETELTRAVEARKQVEERVLSLEARLVEQEAETESTRGLLGETERTRVDLATRLATESSLVASHLVTIGGLRRDLDETISRFSEAETSLIARHGEETDALLAELRGERSRREGLEVELRNTREGLSEALRHAREESVKAQAKLLAEGNGKLSAVEEELSAAIRSREAVESVRNSLEDELNQREEEIESLSERIEDLEIRLRDEVEARLGVLRRLETTRAGFSESLRSGWERLAVVSANLGDESAARKETERALSRACGEIERLSADLADRERRHEAEILEGEARYESLRSEKLTLASEDADLRKIREEIVSANEKKRSIEDELRKLGEGMKDHEARQDELRTQREHLLAEREELKAALNAARLELGSLQKRCSDSRDEETKQAETIVAAERRIQSLRKLEAEMESAVERRRQQHLLSRGEVFSEIQEASAPRPEFSQEDFYRKLIAKLDLIDDLAKRYDNKWLYPKVSEQLGILKRSFIEFLQDHSVKQFDLEPGTVLSLAERKRIKLVPLQEGAARKTNGNGSGSHSSRVVETIRPGYVYQNGSQDVIIRKAEVLVS